jgi:hypothetical protein
MSASDRPTLIPDGEHDTLVDLPMYDLERVRDHEERVTLLPSDGIFYWPEEETL